MNVTKEMARQKVVQRIQQALSSVTGVRVRYPGMPRVDVSLNKTPFLNVDMVYTSGWAVGIGVDADIRALGTIVTEFNFKEGDSEGYKKCEQVLDLLFKNLSSTDDMFPVRTYVSSPFTPKDSVDMGWQRDSLVTPFWYDTSK